MTYSRLDIDPSRYPSTPTVARASGRDLDAQQDVLSGRCFGIDGAGEAYFDPAGAPPGELAMLAHDAAAGRFFLERGESADLHLLAARQALRSSARTTPKPPIASLPQRQASRSAARRRALHAPAAAPPPPAGTVDPAAGFRWQARQGIR